MLELTAEFLLNGTISYLISSPGQGISSSIDMLNVTRIYASAK
jgi:hypothetical protein